MIEYKNKIRIGIDLTSLKYDYLGGGEYFSKNLVMGIVAHANQRKDIEIFLLCRKGYAEFEKYKSSKVNIIYSPIIYDHLSLKSLPYFILFPLVIFHLQLNFIIYPFPSRPLYNGPYIKSISIIHDVQHKIFRKYASSFLRLLYIDFMIRVTLTLSNKVISISKSAKNEIVKYYGKQSKITVINNPIDFKKFKSTYNRIFREDYILYVGSVMPHKNVITLLKAFNYYTSIINTNDKISLLLVGTKQTSTNTIEDFISEKSLTKRVRLIGNVSAKELANYYKNAKLFIYPSVYEGFGMPLVEAMAYKTTVITTRESCLPEVSGGRVNYIDDAYSWKELALLMDRKLKFPESVEVREKNAMWVAKKYNIKHITQKYMEIIYSF